MDLKSLQAKVVELEKHGKESERGRVKEVKKTQKDLADAKKRLSKELTQANLRLRRGEQEVTKLSAAVGKAQEQEERTRKKTAKEVEKGEDTARKLRAKRDNFEDTLHNKVAVVGEARGKLAHLQFAAKMLEQGVVIGTDRVPEIDGAHLGADRRGCHDESLSPRPLHAFAGPGHSEADAASSPDRLYALEDENERLRLLLLEAERRLSEKPSTPTLQSRASTTDLERDMLTSREKLVFPSRASSNFVAWTPPATSVLKTWNLPRSVSLLDVVGISEGVETITPTGASAISSPGHGTAIAPAHVMEVGPAGRVDAIPHGFDPLQKRETGRSGSAPGSPGASLGGQPASVGDVTSSSASLGQALPGSFRVPSPGDHVASAVQPAWMETPALQRSPLRQADLAQQGHYLQPRQSSSPMRALQADIAQQGHYMQPRQISTPMLVPQGAPPCAGGGWSVPFTAPGQRLAVSHPSGGATGFAQGTPQTPNSSPQLSAVLTPQRVSSVHESLETQQRLVAIPVTMAIQPVCVAGVCAQGPPQTPRSNTQLLAPANVVTASQESCANARPTTATSLRHIPMEPVAVQVQQMPTLLGSQGSAIKSRASGPSKDRPGKAQRAKEAITPPSPVIRSRNVVG